MNLENLTLSDRSQTNAKDYMILSTWKSLKGKIIGTEILSVVT